MKAGKGMVKRKSKAIFLKKCRPFIKGTTAGIITAVVFVVLSALIFTATDAPEGAELILGYITLAVSSGVCGMFYGGGKGKNGFAWGTLGGAVIFVLCFIISVISGNFDGSAFASKFVTCLVSGCIGGITGVNLIDKR